MTLSSSIGREREIAELTAMLRHSRLLTVTGPGGADKTRLALEVARRTGGHAWVADLSATDADGVADAVGVAWAEFLVGAGLEWDASQTVALAEERGLEADGEGLVQVLRGVAAVPSG